MLQRPVAILLASFAFVSVVFLSSTPSEAKMSAILTAADNGRTIDLRVGDAITLRLPENASTGYRWAVDAADANLIEIKEGDYVSQSKMPGGGGERQWSIQAKAAGSAQLKLKRWREWQGEGSVVERYEIHLRIAP